MDREECARQKPWSMCCIEAIPINGIIINQQSFDMQTWCVMGTHILLHFVYFVFSRSSLCVQLEWGQNCWWKKVLLRHVSSMPSISSAYESIWMLKFFFSNNIYYYSTFIQFAATYTILCSFEFYLFILVLFIYVVKKQTFILGILIVCIHIHFENARIYLLIVTISYHITINRV